ncbi:MAG: DUF983 domain-containing protein [Chitinophagaceae bacterium]
MSDSKPTPNYWWATFANKCPRCRRGPMFSNNNPYRSLKADRILEMPENCPVCKQKYDLEPGFWYGTGYVSYALAFAMSVTTFVAWYVLIGMSIDDSRVFWWLGINSVLLVVLQPWLMRFSRVVYLRLFVHFDKEYENHQPREFD